MMRLWKVLLYVGAVLVGIVLLRMISNVSMAEFIEQLEAFGLALVLLVVLALLMLLGAALTGDSSSRQQRRVGR